MPPEKIFSKDRAAVIRMAIFAFGTIVILAAASFVIMRIVPPPTPPAVANPGLATETITVGTAKINAEVAATPAAQRQGLSDRTVLASGSGMIFPISPAAQPGFWMNKMHIPLDFIYLNGGAVVELKEHVPYTDLIPFFPNEPVDAVLEVNAGFISANNISVGEAAAY